MVQIQENAVQLYSECQQNVAVDNVMFSSIAYSRRRIILGTEDALRVFLVHLLTFADISPPLRDA